MVYFPSIIEFHSLKIVFGLANSINTDEMLHYAAFQLGIYCLPKDFLRFMGVYVTKG